MITISVDDQINTAEEIARLMKEIDPEGTHSPFSDIKKALAEGGIVIPYSQMDVHVKND